MDVNLTVEYKQSETTGTLYCYGLTVQVTTAVGMPKEIFLFQRGTAPAPTVGEDAADKFVAIADPLDLSDVPVGSPDLQQEMPYYRLSELSLAFRSLADLMDTRTDISNDITVLVRSMRAIGDEGSFTATDVITYDGTGFGD